MEINNSTVYTFKNGDEVNKFLKQAEQVGINWSSCIKATSFNPYKRTDFEDGVDHSIAVINNKLEWSRKAFYERERSFAGFKFEDYFNSKPTTRIVKVGKAKFIFNPPYTIVTDGTHTGKAKCNPAEEYDPITGLEIAKKRFEEAKFPDKSGELLARVQKTVEIIRPRVGDRVEITGGWYHNFKIGDVGVVIRKHGVIDSAFEVKVGDLEQSIKVEDCKLVEELKVGDRVEMIKTRGYSFDKVGNTGIITKTFGNKAEISVDNSYAPFKSWGYNDACHSWKKICTK